MMDIQIRHLQAEEYKAVHQIFLGMSIIRGTMRLPHAAEDYTRQRLEPCEGAIRLVACANEEIVGYCELITYPHVPRHRHVGEINMITVREGWQGKGIGRRLMEAMIELADQWLQITRLGLLVWETNKNAIRLYKDLGFEIEGTMPNFAFGDGEYVNALMMGRLISKRSTAVAYAHQESDLDWLNQLA